MLALLGLREGSWAGLALAGTGGALVYRGLSGHCHLYQSLGINTAESTRHGGVAGYRGVKVEKAVTIHRPADELYRTWRNFENLPRFMHHLVSVTNQGT